MLKSLSVNDLYPLALAEGEGVGTAYEYFAKRLILKRWLQPAPAIRRILIAGLPEKYGCSLDFALLAEEYQAHLLVSDERAEALAKFEDSIAAIQDQGRFLNLSYEMLLLEQLLSLPEEPDEYDLILSSEVIQRVSVSDRRRYLAAIRRSGIYAAIFCPNADNPAHTELSGLTGLSKEELGDLVEDGDFASGFIDMPPFPPGLTRTNEQRQQAASGYVEAVAMSGLGLYARLERFLPEKIRRRQAHIVYGLFSPS